MAVPPRSRYLGALVSLALLLCTAWSLAHWLENVSAARAQVPRSGIDSPFERDRVSGAVPVLGTAVIGDFVRYELFVKPQDQGEEAFSYLDGGTREVVDGRLATWDTSELPAGLYTLRLRVVRADSNYTQHDVHNIIVDPTLAATSARAPAASHKPVSSQSARTLAARGIGRRSVTPDRAVIWFYPSLQGASFQPGDIRLRPLVDALTVNGIAPDQISSEPFARSGAGTLGMVRVTTDQIATVESLLQQVLLAVATDLPVADLVVHFYRQDCGDTVAEATRLALEDARRQAEITAAALGVELGALVQVAETTPGLSAVVGCGPSELPPAPAPGQNGPDGIDVVVGLTATYAVSGDFSLTPVATETVTPETTPTPVQDSEQATPTPEETATVPAGPTATPTPAISSPIETPTSVSPLPTAQGS